AVEPDGDAAAEEVPAVPWVEDRAAARRDHAAHLGAAVRLTERRDRVALERPERSLTFLREDLGDRPARAPLDAFVEVDERGAMALRQSSPNGALATSREADEHDVHLSRRRPNRRPRPRRQPPSRPAPPARSAPCSAPGCRGSRRSNRLRT